MTQPHHIAISAATPTISEQRFDDSLRGDYARFCHTTNEKTKIAESIASVVGAREVNRIFDLGIGNATVLDELLERIPRNNAPLIIAAKEFSGRDVTEAVAKLSARLQERPDIVLAITNLNFGSAPTFSIKPDGKPVIWDDIKLTGTITEAFRSQLSGLTHHITQSWHSVTSPKTGNPVPERQAVLTISREDRQPHVASFLPQRGVALKGGYDLVIASHPWQARGEHGKADHKANRILLPLLNNLAPGGQLVVAQANNANAATEIINEIWPDETPFPVNAIALEDAVKRELGTRAANFNFEAGQNFSFDIALQNESDKIHTAFRNAIYFCQIPEAQAETAWENGSAQRATQRVLERHNGNLQFSNELLVIQRHYDA